MLTNEFLVHRLYENDKSDWLMKKKKEEQYNPQLVDFEGQLFGKIALNDIEKQNDMALGLMKKQKRRFHRAIPIRNIQLNHFLRSSVPSKRILFNEIGKKQAYVCIGNCQISW